MSKVLAFYLPQYHPIKKMMNGGGGFLLNGRMFRLLNLDLVVIINHKFPRIWVFMICGYLKQEKSKLY